MHVWGKLNVKSGMLGLFPWMFKHPPLPNAHLKYYHKWKRCTSGVSFFKRMNEEQCCHQHPRWLCWLWLCSGCCSMRMNCIHSFTVFPLLGFSSAFFWIRLRTHFNQHLMAPLKSAGSQGLWLRAECGEGSRLPHFFHRNEKPPLSLLLFPAHWTSSTTCAPTWTLECLCPGLHASGVASRFWAEQSTPAVLSPPRGRTPERHQFALPSDPRSHRHLYQRQHQENPAWN